MKNIIEIKGLNKSYGKTVAVKDLSFSVREGELFAFLGINGAGKSTTINMMCGSLKKDSGTVEINGNDIDTHPFDVKKDIGVVFQNSVLDKSLSVFDNLVSRASLYSICGKAAKDRIYKIADLLNFKDYLKKSVGKLSGGQRRRVDIARALLHNPKIIILDEPTTGLDPQTRSLLWNTINTLRKEEGLTVFLTTHYMEEAAEADYVVIIDSGRIIAEGTPNDLKNQFAHDTLTIYNADEDSVKALGIPYEKTHGFWKLSISSTQEARDIIVNHPELFSDFEITKGKMDDVFLNATGKNLSGGGKE